MLITLSRRAAICQSVAEFQLTGVAPLGAVSHRFNLLIIIIALVVIVIIIIALYLNHQLHLL